MNKFLNIALLLIIVVIGFSCKEDTNPKPDYLKEGKYLGSYYPTKEWRECAPEEVGLNSSKLKAVYEYCSDDLRKTYGYIIIKDGYIVSEKYLNFYTQDKKVHSYSLAKSFTAALTGIAIQEGYFTGINDKIFNYYPEIQGDNVDPLWKEIQIEHLLMMAAGYQWNEDEVSASNNDLFNMRLTSDYFGYIFNKSMIETPGTVWNYSSGNPLLLGGMIENTVGTTLLEYSNNTLFKDLGITDIVWDKHDTNRTNGAWGLNLKARDYAKLGYLYWKNGIWDGKQVLPEYWVTNTQNPALGTELHYGYLFWKAHRYADHLDQIPLDTYMATGLFQKYIIIIPSYNLVLVRLGEDYYEGDSGWDTAKFIELVIDAVDNQ